jgi:ABC-2 type transport system permease protein
MAARSLVPFGIRQLSRMWRLYAGMDLLWIARGVRDALLWIFAGLVTRLAGVTSTVLLAERFGGIGQWSKAQILFMLAYAMVVGSVLDMLFGYNLKVISRRIGRGQLDHMLVVPQPLWRQFVTEGFMPVSQPWELLVATGLMVWAGTHLPLTISVGWVAVLLLNLLASAAIVLSLQLAWGSIAFWAPRAAEEISSSTNRMSSQLGNLPLDNVPRVLLGGLLTAVPIGFVAWSPSRAIVGVAPLLPGSLVAPLAAPLFLAVAVLVFRKGLQHYVRVGSGRYSTFGHRR